MITVPATANVECGDSIDPSQTGNATATDSCGSVTVTYSDSVAAGSCGNTQTITRTWTATDDCGNDVSQDQIINVIDTTDPVINIDATNIAVECDGSGNNGEIENWLNNNGGAVASDNCGDVTWTNNYNGAQSDCSTPVLVTFTATDACGNTSTTTASYTIQDTANPSIDTEASNLTVQCDGTGNTDDLNDWLTNNGGAIASDDCSTITWTNDFTELSDLCGATGSATVTFTATDGCGNSSTTTAIFTIEDITAPTIDAEASDLTVECDGAGNIDDLNNWLNSNGGAIASDLCGNVTWTNDFTELSDLCGATGSATVTFTATDDCGNFSTTTAIFTIEDTLNPVISTVAADQTVQCDGSGNTDELQAWLDTQAGAVAIDQCSTITWTNNYSGLLDQCGATGRALVTFTATDECGNSSSTTALFTILDLLNPTIDTEASDLTVECDGAGNVDDLNDWLTNNGGAIASDVCSDVTWTNDFDKLADACGATGSATVTFTATDGCGNSSTTTAIFTIVDTTAPTFTVPADVTIECDQDANDLTLTGDVTDEADNCDAGLEATYSDAVADGNCANESVITRTWSVTDDCGNTATLVQTINVVDTTAPTFTVPADVTIECDQDANDLTLTGDVTDEADNCDAGLEATYSDAVADGNCANESVITRTWSLTDDCGNTTTLVQTINVVDTTAPTFTVPADVTIECDQDANDLTLTGDVTDEADNCDSGLEATYSDAVADGNCANESVITRTWSLTDDCGNTATLVQTINVVDTTAPTFTVPADVTIECDQDANDLTLTGDVTDEADNCDAGLEATYSDAVADGNCANESVITRTWSLTDDCGNTATLVQTINVVDTTAPTFTVPADVTIECDQDANDLTLTGDVTDEADNCDAGLEATYSDAVADGNCANESVITRTWSLTDDCGNTATLVQTINVVDTTAPTFTVPADVTIECDQDANDLTLTGDVTDEADNCDSGLEATYSDAVADGNCANESVITRTWSLTDDCGNTATLVQTINVVDTTAPVIDTNATDIIVECDGSGNNGEIENWLNNNGGAVASDNCGAITWTNDYNGAQSDCSAPVTVTFTATDACGNSSTTTASYAIQDTTAPSIDTTSANLTVECDGAGNVNDLNDWLTNNGGAIASDDCSAITWTNDFTKLADACGATGSATVTFTATDGCGNSSTTTAIFTIVDTTAPTFTVPADVTIECDQDANDLTLTGDVTDETDNCDSSLEATYSDAVADGNCANESVITRTWSVTDDCGNTATLVQTINVVDTTAPTFTVPADVTIECDQDANDLTLTGDVTDEADNCDAGLEATYSDAVADGNCANESVITRTWSVTDDCGNTATLVQTINVVDTTAPTFTVPADVTIECDQDANDLTLTGDVTDEADNCDSGLEATYSDAVADGNCANESVITRTWSVTDDCGNTTTLVQTINVVDTTAPTFTVPADVTIECDQDANDLTLTGDVTDEADNCDSGLEATYSDAVADGNCANESVITRTWSVTDDCGNTATLVQTINVVDTTAPTFTVPADVTIECDQDANDLTLTGDVTDEADNCDSGLEATYSDAVADGNCANESVITRTWSLTDDCGNTATLVQTINVVDTTAPTFTVPADVTIECDQDANDLTLTGDVTDEADNCDSGLEATYSDAVADGNCANESVITRTWSVTDDCGNTATLVQTINVVDTTAPTFTVPADVTIECDQDANDLTLTGDVTDEADNCDSGLEATYSDAVADGNCANESVITRTWSLTDDCGNTATLVQTINVVDTTAPTFTVPADVTIECDQDANDLTLTGDVTDEADNCDSGLEATYSDAVADGNCANQSVITRTWSLTDDCGNTTTLVQTINVVDTTAPTFTVPADVTIECDQDANDLTLTGDVTDEADNCDSGLEATYSDAVADGNCANESVITRTWSLTDDCGNTATLVQTINVVDTTAPTFTVPADVTIECDQDANDLTLTGDVTDEADNCDSGLEATYSDAVADGNCANESVITRTWSLTDDCGNTATLVQTINVVDTTAPTFTVPADVTIECDQDANDLTLTGDVTDEADNCDSGLEATYSDAVADGNCANESVITRTWSVTDDCGNTTTLVQTINVVDTTAPTFTVPADVTIECDQDANDLTLTGDVTDEADNCDSGLEATYSDAVADGNCANESVITRTWSVTDDCGNTATLVQTINVVDTTAPTFTVPADVTIECDQDANDLTLTGDVTDEADNCDAGLEATYSDAVADGNCANESVITRTWSVTDDCGNTATLVQTINVVDTTAPTFTVPADVTIECDQDANDLTLTGDVTDEADNCDAGLEATYSDAVADGNCANESVITRTWSVTDDCGNTATLVQTINVVDTTAPVIVGDFEATIDVSCSDIPEVPELVFEDACSSDITVEFNESNDSNDGLEDYSITRSWTVTDECGNEAIYTQIVNVNVESTFTGYDTELCIDDLAIDLFDLLSGDYDSDGVWEVVSGNATLDGSIFDPATADLGDYIFTYTVANGPCPSTVEVMITVHDDCIVLPCGAEDVVISKAVTPNGDQWNEFFTITGVEDCGFTIELQIFNRWGAKIYENFNYQNDWNGTASKASIGRSDKVPSGTYYYIINIKGSNGLQLKPFTGPIYIGTK
ncbi:gliding motility-associated C-terminal domain-containing protein [Gaetbulibacter jejuensis]|uniref:HYR-like domain-containing protein n=1 Tax=Gaetbulibacter jejuensis TaxID=584607 RepID=A0ABN1JQU0_9FLAO